MSKKLIFLREKDIDSINNDIENIIDRATLKKKQLIEPTLTEYKSVKNVIMEFIKKERRIIYGGYAWNELIKEKSPKDAFYKENDYNDIEFYSNKPIEDIVKICNLLYGKNFKYIRGQSAQHQDTYTIFVNFEGYCDITYMPTNIFNAVMTETVNGYKLIHPRFIMVDILRQFNDPIISYWRLDKLIKRSKLLIKYYPFEFYQNQTNIKKLNTLSIEIINHLISTIVSMKTIMFIGQIAFNTYTNPNIDVSKQITIYDNTPLVLFSSNLKDDVYLLYNLILKYFMDNRQIDVINKKLSLEQFYPFFQFTDKHVNFIMDNEIFMCIYGNNEICIPYTQINLQFNKELLSIKIGTFNFLFMFYLIQFHYGYSQKNRDIKNLYDSLMYKLLISKNNFLDTHNKTVLDNTIFEDFKADCIGTPVHPGRKTLLTRYNRKLMQKSAIQAYMPEDKKKYNTEIYNFDNYSGNIINNPRDMIYYKK